MQKRSTRFIHTARNDSIEFTYDGDFYNILLDLIFSNEIIYRKRPGEFLFLRYTLYFSFFKTAKIYHGALNCQGHLTLPVTRN